MIPSILPSSHGDSMSTIPIRNPRHIIQKVTGHPPSQLTYFLSHAIFTPETQFIVEFGIENIIANSRNAWHG
jgi:hypothetical protein